MQEGNSDIAHRTRGPFTQALRIEPNTGEITNGPGSDRSESRRSGCDGVNRRDMGFAPRRCGGCTGEGDSESHPSPDVRRAVRREMGGGSGYQWGQSKWNGSPKHGELSVGAAASIAAEAEGRWASARPTGRGSWVGAAWWQTKAGMGDDLYGGKEVIVLVGCAGVNAGDSYRCCCVGGEAAASKRAAVLICDSLLQPS